LENFVRLQPIANLEKGKFQEAQIFLWRFFGQLNPHRVAQLHEVIVK
jgi:hypothetical protein